MTADFILNELLSVANPERAEHSQRFFKTGKGQYAEGDVFLGLAVPLTRSIVKENRQTLLSELQKLIESKYHEARLCALLILVEQYKKADSKQRRNIFDFYLRNTSHINNWDLVDLSCYHIVGNYLLDKDRSLLFRLADSQCLWEQRIAMVSTLTFIKNNDFTATLLLAEKLITHKHDLMHKAVGWMLREVGKRDRALLTQFLEKNATRLPRTALRYAIEHYAEDERQYFLKKR